MCVCVCQQRHTFHTSNQKDCKQHTIQQHHQHHHQRRNLRMITILFFFIYLPLLSSSLFLLDHIQHDKYNHLCVVNNKSNIHEVVRLRIKSKTKKRNKKKKKRTRTFGICKSRTIKLTIITICLF